MSTLIDQLRGAVRTSNQDHDQLAAAAGMPRTDFDRLMSDNADLSVKTAERLAFALRLELEALPKRTADWLNDDNARKAEEKRLPALADSWAYEGAAGRARRVEERVLIAFNPVLLAVYMTPDSVYFVDYWYRQRLGYGDDPENTVGFHSSGRRMSTYRDKLKYRREPTSKKGPVTIRQFVFEAERTRFVVLAQRQPDATMTEIAITVLPFEGNAGTPEPKKESIVTLLDAGKDSA